MAEPNKEDIKILTEAELKMAPRSVLRKQAHEAWGMPSLQATKAHSNELVDYIREKQEEYLNNGGKVAASGKGSTNGAKAAQRGRPEPEDPEETPPPSERRSLRERAPREKVREKEPESEPKEDPKPSRASSFRDRMMGRKSQQAAPAETQEEPEAPEEVEDRPKPAARGPRMSSSTGGDLPSIERKIDDVGKTLDEYDRKYVKEMKSLSEQLETISEQVTALEKNQYVAFHVLCDLWKAVNDNPEELDTLIEEIEGKYEEQDPNG